MLVADTALRDLTALRLRPRVRAESGRPGEGSNRTGADGKDTILRVPVGTQVHAVDGTLVRDLAHAGARVVIARGGRGGAGNSRFTTATRQAPRIAGVGEDGDARTVELQLKLLADAALLGFPNVGKSSLLRRVSNATPRVADYPFTTIEPVLGTVDSGDGRQITVVDVPGLLEGASEGVGLGHEFLAHLERARLLLHVVAADEAERRLAAARDRFDIIYRELVAHGHGLAGRQRIVVLNKIDLVPPSDRDRLVRDFADAVADDTLGADWMVVRDDNQRPVVIGTSCATGEGIPDLITALFRFVPTRDEPPIADELADYLVYQPAASRQALFRILRVEGGFRVTGEFADRAERAAHDDHAELAALLVDGGVRDALDRAGARAGDEILVGEQRLTFPFAVTA